MTSLYAAQTPVAERRAQCERIAAKHGERMIPIVLEATGKHAKVNFTALPPTATFADLQAAVREVGDASRKTSRTVAVAGCTPSAATTIGDLYAACKSEDGFLYVNYTGENTMGFCFAIASGGGGGGSGTGSDSGNSGINLPGDTTIA